MKPQQIQDSDDRELPNLLPIPTQPKSPDLAVALHGESHVHGAHCLPVLLGGACHSGGRQADVGIE